MVVNLVIGPHITQVYRSGNKARLQALSRNSARVALLVALPVALPLIFLGGPILGMVFGQDYRDLATWPLAILVTGQLVNVMFGSVGILLTMSGYERDALLGHALALFVNFILALVFVPIYGVIGAAVAASIGLIVWNVVLALKVVKRLGVRPAAL